MKVRITEAELARDVHAVPEWVERGGEVVVERDDHSRLAVIRSPRGAAGRLQRF